MKAAIFQGSGKMEIGEYPLKKLDKFDIRIQVGLCGLCGTDFHIFKGEAPSNPPLITGHEYAGTVVETGSGVSGIKIGDKIAVDPNIYCGRCSFCRTGNIQFCENLKALGVTTDGGFAEYSVIPLSQAYKLPENFQFNIAAFAEPLSCCVHGIDNAAIKHGESVAIIGAGTIGLLMLQLTKISGASKIIVLEPVIQKRTAAKNLGADYVFDPGSKDIKADIMEVTSGGPDVVIECAGNSEAAQIAIGLAKKGGRVIIFGLSAKDENIQINLQDFFHREITLKSSLLNPFTFSRALDLLISGNVDVSVLKPAVKSIYELPEILNKPRNFSVTKYLITPN